MLTFSAAFACVAAARSRIVEPWSKAAVERRIKKISPDWLFRQECLGQCDPQRCAGRRNIVVIGIVRIVEHHRPRSLVAIAEKQETAGNEIGRAHVELQSLMRISYAVFCLKKKKNHHNINTQ